MHAAYAAGFFDGEGAVVTHSSALELHVTQTQLEVLQLLQDEYGGTITVHREGPVAAEREVGVWRKSWRWKIIGYRAAACLHAWMPYLVVKRERATAALAWWDERVADRQRLRMPNSYYTEAKLEGRVCRLNQLTEQEKQEELRRREEWLAARGWD